MTFHIKSQLRLLWCDSGQVATGEASFKLRPVCFLRDVRALTFSCLLDFIWVSSGWRLSTRVSWLLRIALVVLLFYFSEGLVFLGSACIPPKICSPVASGKESHPLKLGENGLLEPKDIDINLRSQSSSISLTLPSFFMWCCSKISYWDQLSWRVAFNS